MIPVRVVLDTNVLHAGLYSSRGASYQVLKAVEKGKIKIILSTALLFEYEDILVRNRSVPGLSVRDIDVVLDNLCKLAEHHRIFFLWRPYLAGPKDDHILELAVASGTTTIVTHNIKDFRGIRKFGIRAIPPKKLLEEIS